MNISDFLDRPIAFHRCLRSISGSTTSALLLSQALYWHKRTTLPDGWFYKTASEWEEETGLSTEEQSTARARLIRLGFMQEKKYGTPCTLHFKVCVEEIEKALLSSPKLVSGNHGNLIPATTETNTEITTETTSEKKIPPSAGSSSEETSQIEAGSETPSTGATSPLPKTPATASGGTKTRTPGSKSAGGGKAFVKSASSWAGPAPYLDIWKREFGGYFAVEKSSRQFRQAENDHGRERVVQAFDLYCRTMKKKGEAQFASPIRFCEKVAVWLPKKEEPSKGYIPDNWEPQA